MQDFYNLVGNLTYVVQFFQALWGAYCAVLVWRRVGMVRFRRPSEQEDFFKELDSHLNNRNLAQAEALCEGERRAMPQLALFALQNRGLNPAALQRRLVERFQQDVLADIEHRLSWVANVTKTAPMVGLFGTVIGMMATFGNLSEATQVDPGQMAGNIMLALITTAIGLAIAVPLMVFSASMNTRIRKMEDLMASGLARLMDSLSSLGSRNP